MNEEEYLEGGFASEADYLEWKERNARAEANLAETRELAEFTAEEVESAQPPQPQQSQQEQQQAPPQQQQEQPQQQQEPKKEPKRKGLQLGWGPDYMDENLPENTKATLAMMTGVYDTILDGLSLIPGISHTNVPKFEDEATQSIRTISSVLVPSLLLGGGGSAALASKTGHIKLLADPFVKWAGNALFQAGTGAAVDYVAETNQEDDNLAGTFKKIWPRTLAWIPDDIATLDSDSPDQKRMKNVSEGAYLGVTTDFLVGAAKLFSNISGTHRIAGIVPENEKAAKWFKDNVEIDATPADAVERSAAKRYDALDDVGAYNFDAAVELGTVRSPNAPVDTRGKGKFYHGTSEPIAALDNESYYAGTNIYGEGFYTTDDLTTANKYQKKNKGNNKITYEIDELSDVQFYDLDQPVDDSMLRILQDTAERSSSFDQALGALEGDEFSLAQFMDEVRAFSRNENESSFTITEYFDNIIQDLKAQGFGGFTHQGGKLAGKNKRLHQVKIYWEPKNQINIREAETPVSFSGSPNFEKSVDMEQRIFGYTDNYGYAESGIRSVDDLGIVGASIDLSRINGDLDTVYGRLGSVMSERALKFALEGVEEGESVIKGLASVLQDAGEYGYRASDGRYRSFKEVQADSDGIANDLYEMDIQQMRRMFEFGGPYKKGIDADTQVGELTSEAYGGVVKSIKKYMDDFINMDEARARAYTVTSLAGQISDMAEGMRLTQGSGSIVRAQEQILDRVEFLMFQKAQTSYVRGRALNMTNLWNRMTRSGDEAYDAAYAKRIENQIKSEKNSTLSALAALKNETKRVTDGLREINNTNPEFLAPLMMAYELTNGNVKSMTSLGNYVKQSTSVLGKALYDQQPEIPSVLITGFYANVYNSALSALATPIKAGISGAHLLIEKPIRHFAGALLNNNDTSTLRRGFHQYSSMVDSVRRASKYASQIFRKSAVDPNVIAVRDDVGLKNQGQLDVLRSYADAAASTGNFGPQYLMEQIDAINDLANHPLLRFGTRSMQAIDGFVQSMVADFEAKGRAFDRITRGGTLPFTPDKADEYFKEAHAAMFDENGIITDNAVRNAAGEISLNLDDELNDSVSALLRRMPVLKPLFLFTKTPINELKLTGSYQPAGLFLNRLNAFRLPFDEMDADKAISLLKQRGVDVNKVNARTKYNEIRADLKGRKAIGTILTGSAVALFMDDRLHGNGHYNRQVQKTRRESGWKPRSIKGLDGKWYSYDGLGPITTYLALVADIIDNYGSLDGNDMGELLHKTVFVAAASFKDKSYLAGLEPMVDIFNGDVGAINRWSSSFLTAAAIRGSSQMAEIGRLLDPGMKVINNDLRGMIFNRLPGLKSTLPVYYDWIDGTEVNDIPITGPESIIARLRNVYTPWKESGQISDEKQFLIDIEYDATAALRTHRGEVLNNREQSEILNILGKTGRWKQGIERVMQSIEGKQFRKEINEARAKGLSPDVDTYKQIHRRLDFELKSAMKDAVIRSDSYTDIMKRRELRLRPAEYMKYGDIEGAEAYLESVKRDLGL